MAENCLDEIRALSAAELRQHLAAFKASGCDADCRVSGNKQALAERVLECLRAEHPRSWESELKKLVKGKKSAPPRSSGGVTSKARARRRRASDEGESDPPVAIDCVLLLYPNISVYDTLS